MILLSWAPPRPVESLVKRWAPQLSRFIERSGMQMHIRGEGRSDDPVPLVLLHGTSASQHSWEGVVEELKPQRRVISLDLPGFGLTGPFPDGVYRMERYVTFLSTLLDELEISRAVLVGNSFGGQLAWEMALAQPRRVQRLVLIEAAGYRRQSTSVPIGTNSQLSPHWPADSQHPPAAAGRIQHTHVYGDPDN